LKPKTFSIWGVLAPKLGHSSLRHQKAHTWLKTRGLVYSSIKYVQLFLL